MEKKLALYGTPWCMKSARLRNFLQSKWIEFDDHDVEANEDSAEKVRSKFNGVLKFPVLMLEDKVLKNPSIEELSHFLKENDID